MPRALPVSVQAPNGFLFEETSDRPFRTISIETEVDGHQGHVPETLFRAGVVGANRVMNYSYNPGLYHPHVAFVKSDATVTCGEIVFDRLNLSQERDAVAFNDSLVWLRQLEREGDLSYSPSCGGHIHVDASGYGYYDVARLMDLFAYLEEPIFRLAGSGKTYGHRSLYAARTGRNGYAQAIVKKQRDIRDTEWYSWLRGAPRVSALNLTRYWNNTYCHGGCDLDFIGEEQEPRSNSYEALYGPDYAFIDRIWEDSQTQAYEAYQVWINAYTADHNSPPSAAARDRRGRELMRYYGQHSRETRMPKDSKKCTCPTNGRTIEWRVWNSTGHPRIMYAWIALMQAMHAYCWRAADDPRYREVEDKEPMPWETRHYETMKARPEYEHMAKERIEFMFRELPLLPQEKNALAYAFMRTPYGEYGQEYFAHLAKLPYVKSPGGSQDYDKTAAGYRAPTWQPVQKDGLLEPADAVVQCDHYLDIASDEYRARNGEPEPYDLDYDPDYDPDYDSEYEDEVM